MKTDQWEIARRFGGISRNEYQKMLLGLMHAAVKLEEVAKIATDSGAAFAEAAREDCNAVLAAYMLLKDLEIPGRTPRIM